MIRYFAAALMLLCTSLQVRADEPQFHLRFSKALRAEPFSGRVLILFSQTRSEPRTGPGWFRPEKFLAVDIDGWGPEEVLEISPSSNKLLSFPKPLSEMKLDGYKAQAVVRFNPISREVGNGTGNGYSPTVELNETILKAPVKMVVDKLVGPREFKESKWTKLLRVRSPLLSKFYGREVFMHASVTLPASYHENEKRRFPTIFTIPGFGGTHRRRPRMSPLPEDNEEGVEFLRVTLDPTCPLGHHVFADSANNGPVGAALIKELIPALEKQFRAIAKPHARFLRGHSSGGWSSLWLQVTYPDFFGGTWSTSPDPVDFRDFQRIDLYQPKQNMYRDSNDKVRPLARRGEKVMITYESFSKMEWVLGHGGQLHSFEAAFSPRGDDGKPMLLWDRESGHVDRKVAETWKKYDIRLILEKNWPELEPKLKGKLHVITGGLDTFYLEGAVRLLKESLAELSSDPVVEIHPGKSHGSVLTKKVRDRIYDEMVATFKKHDK